MFGGFCVCHPILPVSYAILQAVRELTDNMVFIGGELNATEGHVYFRETELGKDPVTGASAGSQPMLTFRDNGRGMTEKTWTERASRICRAADTQVDYTPDLAQTLSRFGGRFDDSPILMFPP